MSGSVLTCWHSRNNGIKIAESTVRKLSKKEIELDRIIYLYQPESEGEIPAVIENIPVQGCRIDITDPSNHIQIYQQLKEKVVPLLRTQGGIHINISPGTAAMHSVWLMLHAGGAFPSLTRVWSSQYNPDTKRTSLNEVDFPITTYLAELRKGRRIEPRLASYEIEAQSPARRSALEKLARYSQVPYAPILLLGERGTGKTRLVESVISKLKNAKKVITVPCGGLDSSVLESTIFGHKKGAFTGAEADREGLLKAADIGILFLDEVQDLPANVQRKLVRVLQDFRHRYRPLGSDQEISSDFQLVCASNKSRKELRSVLDTDFFDRISHLEVTIPPLRECRLDIREDWGNVWQEMNGSDQIPAEAPWTDQLASGLAASTLSGNLRSLQKLALLVMVWLQSESIEAAIERALEEWGNEENAYKGSRDEQIKHFKYDLAVSAKKQYGTWDAAAEALGCTEKTLRNDAGLFQDE
jgi:DNA-binding NtrC family response regulator